MQTLAPGKYTIFKISEWSAMTQKDEIEVIRINESDQRAIYKPRRKRKEYYLNLKDDTIVFQGWDIPIKTDTEFHKFFGNACFNLVADSLEILTDWLSSKNVFPLTDMVKGSILFSTTEQARDTFGNTGGMILFREVKIKHAVIDRMKKKQDLISTAAYQADDRGGTGHGDISYSDADTGL